MAEEKPFTNCTANQPGTAILASQEQLEMLGYKSGDRVCIRSFFKNRNDSGKKGEFLFPEVPQVLLKDWESQGRGIYLVVNSGGHKDPDIDKCRAIFYEHDDLGKEIQAELWRSLNLPQPTFQVDTGGKSVHSFWVFDEPISVSQWRLLQADLLEFADADRKLKNPSRLMRLAGWKHNVSGENSKIISKAGDRYSYEQLRSIIPKVEKRFEATGTTWAQFEKETELPIKESISLEACLSRASRDRIQKGESTGSRNDAGFQLACDLIGTSGYLLSLGQSIDVDPKDLFYDFCRSCDGEDWGQSEWESIWKSAEKSRPGSSLSPENIETCAKAWLWRERIKPTQATDLQRPKTLKELEADPVNEIESKYKQFRQQVAIALQIGDPILRDYTLEELSVNHRKSKIFMRRMVDELEQRRKPQDETEFDLVDLLNEKTHGTTYLIEDWLPLAESILLTAKPKVGKSLLAYDAAHAVATGGEFLGKRTKQGRVMIIQTEEGKGELRKRLYTRGFDQVPKGQVKIWTQFKVHKDMAKLEAELSEFRPSLIVIDSLRRITAGSGISENEAAFGNFVYELSDVTRAYGASLIVIHHDKKDKEAQGIDAISGSLSLAGATWGSWRLIQTSTAENSIERQLSCTIRGGASSRHIIQLQEGEGCSWGWEWLQEMGADPEVHSNEKRILCILHQNNHAELSMSEIVRLLGLPPGSRSLYRPMNRLIERGRVEMRRDPDNRRLWWYRVPTPPLDTPPPTVTQKTVQPSDGNGCTPAQESDHPPLTNNYSPFNKQIDQLFISDRDRERSCTPDQQPDQVVDQVCNLDRARVAHFSMGLRGGSVDTPPSSPIGAEYDGVWQYAQNANPQFRARPQPLAPKVQPCQFSAGDVVVASYPGSDRTDLNNALLSGGPPKGFQGFVVGTSLKDGLFGRRYWSVSVANPDSDRIYEILDIDLEVVSNDA